MTVLRPRLRGLVFKLALFYLLLSVPTLVVVESAILIFEFGQFMSGVAGGTLDRAAEQGAADLAAHWTRSDGTSVDEATLRMWLDAWTLRLRQPRGGLTPDESYVLLELADAPLAAAVLTPDGRELARSTGDGRWAPTLPGSAEAARSLAGDRAMRLAGAESPYKIRRVLAPVAGRDGTPLGVLFVELRLPLPWHRLFVDSSYESPTVFAFLIVFGIASSIFLAWWVTRRLNRVAGAATAWSRGDFSNRIGDASRDEIGGLSALLDRMAVDLRGLMRSRAQLATLAERQRLARDLHDTVKQKAFALNLQLATARRVLGNSPGNDRLDQAQRLTQQIQQELAQILDELRASDTELPFAERLRARALDWSHTSGIVPDFALDDVPTLAPADEESLLRILDEALANVLRHAGASKVEITLRREADRVHLAIIDNGRGIAAAAGGGMGLRNMRERAEALPGGRFTLDTLAGQGTRVALSFIVAENPNA